MKNFLLIAILCSSFALKAQEVNGGIKAGWNTSQIVGTPSSWEDVSFEYASSWHAGGFLTFGLSDALALRGELLYSRKGSLITVEDSVGSVEARLNLDYITIPVLLQYRIGALSLHAGPEIGLKIQSNSSDDRYFITNPDLWDQQLDLSVLGGVTLHLGNVEVSGRYGHSMTGLTEINTTDPDGRFSGSGTHGQHSFWQISIGLNLF